MLETLTKDIWEACLDGNFQVEIDDRNLLDLKLHSVSGFGQHPQSRREAYSLMFQGPMQPVLMQKIHRIRHQQMGQLDIFLVPLGPEGGVMRYEAIFA